jgi:formiminoglutamase
MASFRIFSQGDILGFVNKRDGETKLGEKVQTIEQLLNIEKSTAKFVLLGIPEDIGVRANYGIGGAKTAWNATLKAILNTQSNSFLNGEEILVLGHFEIEEPTDQSLMALRNKVAEIDELVYPIIQQIITAGKIPIVIGGGHNNCYPIIKGTSLALNTKVNVVNIDAHTDLRNPAEGRHSGNGFSSAIKDGYLNQYQIFGLHQNYANKGIADQIQANQNMNALYFEELLQSDKSIVQKWANFTENLNEGCGLEIDLDSIENVLSSAISPSGFALNDIRKILLSGQKEYRYLHICEGATALADGREDLTTGKTIAYLVADFIKARQLRISPQP